MMLGKIISHHMFLIKLLWNVAAFREDNVGSISPLRPLKTRYKYLPIRLFGLPFSIEDEEAIEIKKKSGTEF